jgi:hypothetical protein
MVDLLEASRSSRIMPHFKRMAKIFLKGIDLKKPGKGDGI